MSVCIIGNITASEYELEECKKSIVKLKAEIDNLNGLLTIARAIISVYKDQDEEYKKLKQKLKDIGIRFDG